MLTIHATPKGSNVPELINEKDFFAALSTQIVNNPDRVFLIKDRQFDYATVDITILSAELKTNALYVDTVFGDDATAQKNSFEKKYKSITAAEMAAIAGETIVVFPGNYVEAFLGKNGLTYSFPFGANVQCAWTGGNLNYSVTGFADFSSSFHSPVNAYLNSNINIQCKSITGMRLGFPAVFASSGCKVNVQVFGDINHTNSDTIQSTDFNTELHVTANRILSTARACSVIAGGTTGHKQFIYAKEIILGGGGSLTWSNGGYQEIHYSKCTRSINDSFVGGVVLQQGFFPSTPIVNLYGSYEDNGLIAIDLNNNNGQLEYNGNITGVGGISITGSGCSFMLKGDATVNRTAAVIVQNNGKVETRGRIKNISNTAASHGITKNGGTLILNHSVIITTHAASQSINSTTDQSFISYASFANKNTYVNVVLQVGNFQSDPLVQ